MGTNFYWNPLAAALDADEWLNSDRDDPRVHIGKRSAAGHYCWDCDRTLCKGGNAAVHTGRSQWYSACPSCGRTPEQSSGLKRGPAAVELGFAKPETERPTGVSGTSSFSWAQDPERVGAICDAHPNEPLVVDEYGAVLTGREFMAMLRANCAITLTDVIGMVFS